MVSDWIGIMNINARISQTPHSYLNMIASFVSVRCSRRHKYRMLIIRNGKTFSAIVSAMIVTESIHYNSNKKYFISSWGDIFDIIHFDKLWLQTDALGENGLQCLASKKDKLHKQTELPFCYRCDSWGWVFFWRWFVAVENELSANCWLFFLPDTHKIMARSSKQTRSGKRKICNVW